MSRDPYAIILHISIGYEIVAKVWLCACASLGRSSLCPSPRCVNLFRTFLLPPLAWPGLGAGLAM